MVSTKIDYVLGDSWTAITKRHPARSPKKRFIEFMNHLLVIPSVLSKGRHVKSRVGMKIKMGWACCEGSFVLLMSDIVPWYKKKDSVQRNPSAIPPLLHSVGEQSQFAGSNASMGNR